MAVRRHHLRWADMESDHEAPSPMPRYVTASVQTGAPFLWRNCPEGALAVFSARRRPTLPHAIHIEVLSYISWILEMLMGPCTLQFHRQMRAWRESLRRRIWRYRLRYLHALAVFGIAF